MINDNRMDFMNAVSMKAEEYRSKSFEACLEGLMKSVVKESLTVEVPKNADASVKNAIANEVKTTINTTAKELASNAVNNDYGQVFNVDLAHEIVNPKNFCESAQQMIAESIFAESDDRAALLAAQFDAGRFNGSNSEEVLAYVEKQFSNEAFDTRFDNGVELKKNLKLLLSTEGEEVVEEIKNDVAELVQETEAKNSVIREAVADINEAKAKIEEKINGEAETADGQKPAEGESKDDSSTDQAASSEGWYDKAVKNRKYYSTEDFYQILSGANRTMSTEAMNASLDTDSFSREEADTILKAFQDLDGIDSDSIQSNPETLSVSNADQAPADNAGVDGANGDSQSAEYVDSNGEEITINSNAFADNDTIDGIKAEELSGEAMARDFMPLSFKKVGTQKIQANTGKLAAYLALTPDHGESFFTNVQNRRIRMANMLSKEDAICDGIAKDDIDKKLDDTIGLCKQVQVTTETITEDLGILGILEGNYQRTDSHIQNAVNSIFKPTVIAPMGKEMSKEELYESNLAEIFKLSIKLADVKSDLANDIDVLGNKDQLGYIDELLNEKMFNVDPIDQPEVESKVKALQSIESIVDIEDLVNMQLFVAEKSEKEKPAKVKLNSLKDIDAYGFSYIDEIEEIKKDVKSKFKEHMTGAKASFKFNTDELVDSVVEEMDTTKLTSNLYEKVISKLVEDHDVTNSTEGLVIKNKAKTITTGYIAGSKLGYLTEQDVADIREHLSK